MNVAIAVVFLVIVGPVITVHAGDHQMDHQMPHEHPDQHHQHPAMEMDMAMRGMLGPYAMSREASGTSWQPERSPMDGMHATQAGWMLHGHGVVTLIYDNQGGERGDRDIFGTTMLMGMAQRPLGPGTFGARTMLSLEPLTIGEKGYPLLLQTGETANGRDPLIDRQHPHDLFMELATTYSVPVTEESSFFVYLGLPGEPALGPPTFMHRFSAMETPEAPLTHHWLDSTHITFGVATLGYIWDTVKIEGSTFRGREPDEDRWDIEAPAFDSYAARVSYNPTESWAFQGSYGLIDSPEQLEPEVDTDRATLSASYHAGGEHHQWQTTFAWGRNMNDPGRSLDGFLLESTLNLQKRHTLVGRVETVEKDELFAESHPDHGLAFWLTKASLGYIYDLPEMHRMQWGVGGLASLHVLPNSLEEAYGSTTPFSFMLFTRVKL